jgi:hypothetical protein
MKSDVPHKLAHVIRNLDQGLTAPTVHPKETVMRGAARPSSVCRIRETENGDWSVLGILVVFIAEF